MSPLPVAEVVVYASGLVACSVCAPADMPIEELTRAVNDLNPTGIVSPWALSAEPTFASGPSNPCPCEHNASRLHYLFDC